MSQTRLQQVIKFTSAQERKTARNLLIRARNKLVKGWTKYQEVEYDQKGRAVSYCSIGALRNSRVGGTKGYTSQYRAYEIARSTVSALLPNVWGGSITGWNDHHRRTKDQVINTFDKAIAALEREAKPNV